MSEVKIISATIANKNAKKDKYNNIKKRVCAYARVSTDEEEQITSYKSQISHYSTLIKSNHDWEYVGVYADEGISGTQVKNRNEFKRMINDVLSGKIDMIIAKSISRFARNTLDTLKYVRLLREHNVDVFFEKENIHTLELDSEMFLTLYSAFAQAESESTSMNVKMGFRAKMKRGEACGTIACYGYNWDSYNKELSINELEANVVIKIFKWYLEGYGSSRICRMLENENIPSAKGGKKWHPSVVKCILRNEKYAGDLCGQKYYVASALNHRSIINRGEKDKFYVRDHHIPIISRDVFDAAQKIYNKRSKQVKDGKEYCEKFSLRYPLSSMIVCGNCGNAYVRRVTHHRNKEKELINYVYWTCSCNKYKKGYCDKNLAVREMDIEKLFIELFEKLQKKVNNNSDSLFEKIYKTIILNDPEKEIKKLEKDENIINSKISKLLDLKLQNNLDDKSFSNKYDELKVELEELKKKKEIIMSNNYSTKEQKSQLKKIENELKSFKITKFNIEVFKKLVKKVIVGGEDDDGEYKTNIVRFVLNFSDKSFCSLGCYDRTYKT